MAIMKTEEKKNDIYEMVKRHFYTIFNEKTMQDIQFLLDCFIDMDYKLSESLIKSKKCDDSDETNMESCLYHAKMAEMIQQLIIVKMLEQYGYRHTENPFPHWERKETTKC